MTKVAGSKYDISEGAILQLLLKLGGEQNQYDSGKSFVRKDAFVNTMFNAMNMKSFNEKKFDQVIVTLWIKGKYKDDPKKLETNLILLHIWEAFDWNKDGRQTLDEFSAFAEGYFGNEEDPKGVQKIVHRHDTGHGRRWSGRSFRCSFIRFCAVVMGIPGDIGPRGAQQKGAKVYQKCPPPTRGGQDFV